MRKRIDLNNGLRIILNHMPYMESTAIGVWIAAGSRREDKRISGISHFLEHMLFKGTPSRSNRKIKEEIEGRGGSLNAFTSEEITCYLAKVSSRHASLALEVLSDMVIDASLEKNDIERERTVIMEEIKMYRDLPNHHVHDVLSKIMWPKNPLGLSVAGDTDSVSSITRRDLLSYKKANYSPGNIAIVLCGNLKQRSAAEKAKKIFQKKVTAKSTPVVKFNKTQTTPQVKILNKGTEQTRLCMGLHTPGRRHKDRFIMTVLHIILGANMSSRLFENVREKKGLAYEIGTGIKRYSDTGAFIVNAGIDHKKTKEAVSLIVKELKSLKEKLVPHDELRRAKEYFRVQLSLALEDTLDHMLWLGEPVIMTDKTPDKKDIIKKIMAVSSADIKRVAKNIFVPSGANLAIIGPLKDKEQKNMEKELSNL